MQWLHIYVSTLYDIEVGFVDLRQMNTEIPDLI